MVEIDKDSLYRDVERLTSISPWRNYENISSLNETADYIADRLKENGCEVRLQEYRAFDEEYRNVICSFEASGSETERIVVGAHYDVCGDQPGADDNASGVAGILELARLLSVHKPDLKYPIDIVAYSTEEPPVFRSGHMGSAVHAKMLSDEGVGVRVMICLEMIGYFSSEPKSQHYPLPFFKWVYPSTGDFILVAGKTGQGSVVEEVKRAMSKGTEIDVQSIVAPSLLPGIDFSDHINYWRNGFKAVMITDTAFYRNPNYHGVTDTIDTLDFDMMALAVKGIYSAVVNL